MALHNAKRYADVIAVINAALINRQSQPWMYPVLGMSMKLEGYPQDEVNRALLSSIDFTASDVPSMLYSAAYLRRLNADEAALHLYEQASRLAPVRPEPYVLGMRIATRLKQWERVGWGAAGTLSFAWTKEHETLHKEAIGLAQDAAKELRMAGKMKEVEKLQKQIAEARQRDLVVKITWAGKGDLDLEVTEPGGATCSYKEPQTNGGGFLTHEGRGPDQKNCYESYVCPVASPGSYVVRVKHVYGDIVGKRATVEVIRYRGSQRESTFKQTVQLSLKGTEVSVPLNNGRGRRVKKPSGPAKSKAG